MTESHRERLIAEIDVVTYTPLAQHTARGGLFLVDAGISLLDVALSIAENRTSEVEGYIAAEKLRRPTGAEHEAFTKAPEAYSFSFVIVQPFVLAQLTS